MALYPSGKRSKKFRSILFKGLWVSRGQSPPFTQETDIHSFSRLKSVPVLVVLRSKTQNILQIFGVKIKSIGIFYFWIEIDAVWNQFRMKRAVLAQILPKEGDLTWSPLHGV